MKMSFEQALALSPLIEGKNVKSLDDLGRAAFNVLQAEGAADAVAANPNDPSSLEECVAIARGGNPSDEWSTNPTDLRAEARNIEIRLPDGRRYAGCLRACADRIEDLENLVAKLQRN